MVSSDVPLGRLYALVDSIFAVRCSILRAIHRLQFTWIDVEPSLGAYSMVECDAVSTPDGLVFTKIRD